VREQSTRGVGLGVIADENDGVERVVEPLHHAVPFEAVADEARALIEIFRQEIALTPMGVVDEDVGGAAVKGAADGGIGVLRHQLAGTAVFGLSRGGLVFAADPRDAFEIDRDVNALSLLRFNAGRHEEHEGHEEHENDKWTDH
jgi:hypothetical protein